MASKRSSVRLIGNPSHLSSTPKPASHQVLIVEDEILLAREIEAHLMDLGYGITAIALSAPEAIAVLETQPVDIVLMDIMLSGEMDGITTAVYVRQEFHLPIIYLTAYSDVHMLSQAAFTCPSGYLMKPCTTTDLYITLEIALAHHQLEDGLRQALQEAERLTTVDNVTGVLTAHRLWTMANKEFHRARRYQHHFSLVMLDVALMEESPGMAVGFLHGHQGMIDRLLSTVAHTVQNCLRQADYLGHLEHEGFGLILPETDAQSAIAVAKRIQQALSQLSPNVLGLEFPAKSSPLNLPITNGFNAVHPSKSNSSESNPAKSNIRENNGLVVNIGVADWCSTDADVVGVFQRAETALIQSKDQGGNRIVVQR